MRRLVTDTRTLTPSIIRDRALEAAGLNPESVGAYMRQATDTLLAQLEAMTTKFFAEKGRITDSAEITDNQARIAAAAHLLTLGVDIMALKRRAEPERVQEQPSVTIDLSGWTVQPPTTLPTTPTTDHINGEVAP